MKKHGILGKKALLLSLMLSLLFGQTAFASWENEQLGPGAAVWVDEQNPDGTKAEPAQTPQAPEGSTITYVDGVAVSITNPDGTKQSLAAGGASEAAPEGAGTEAPAGSEASADGTGAANTDTAAPAAGSSQQPAETGGTADSTAQTAAPETGTDNAAQTAAPDASQQNPNLVLSNGRYIDLTKPMIALTYDDGPYAPVGNRIMNTVEQYNGRVTFFMVGDRVKSYATEVRRMVSGGHEVANHSYSHKYLNRLDAASIRSEVEKCNAVIQEVSGVRPTLMRLPGGNKNAVVLQNVNMPIILWNIDTRDWETKNAQKTVNSIVGKVKDGDIVLMHELYTATADATDSFVPQLAAQGFQFVTVSELAKFKGKSLTPNQIYYSIR